jgi:branched-chain amino acid transport system substrate-binding protein
VQPTATIHRRAHVALPLLIAATTALAACGGGGGSPAASGGGATLLVAVVAPVTADPYVARSLRGGTDLAVHEINARGGVAVGGTRYHLVLRTYDDALDPQRTRSAMQSAIHDGAVGIVTDGQGAAGAAGDTASAGVPVVVVDNGDTTLLDPAARPSFFRLGIADDAAAGVLSAYVAKSGHAPAIIHDDSDNGRDGGKQMQVSLATAGVRAVADIEAAAAVPAVDAQVRAALDAHADSIVVWGGDAFTAKLVQAAHLAAPHLAIFSGPSGESPAVRALAGADASDGLAFVSARMTSEDDSVSFGQFEHRLAEFQGGPIAAGIKDREGRAIRQPADREIFSYDAVAVIADALSRAGSAKPSRALLAAMLKAHVRSANGDARGFNPDNHEGVADDDMYIARIHDMVFAPVKDESLSATLPTADQILADFH